MSHRERNAVFRPSSPFFHHGCVGFYCESVLVSPVHTSSEQFLVVVHRNLIQDKYKTFINNEFIWMDFCRPKKSENAGGQNNLNNLKKNKKQKPLSWSGSGICICRQIRICQSALISSPSCLLSSSPSRSCIWVSSPRQQWCATYPSHWWLQALWCREVWATRLIFCFCFVLLFQRHSIFCFIKNIWQCCFCSCTLASFFIISFQMLSFSLQSVAGCLSCLTDNF